MIIKQSTLKIVLIVSAIACICFVHSIFIGNKHEVRAESTNSTYTKVRSVCVSGIDSQEYVLEDGSSSVYFKSNRDDVHGRHLAYATYRVDDGQLMYYYVPGVGIVTY